MCENKKALLITLPGMTWLSWWAISIHTTKKAE